MGRCGRARTQRAALPAPESGRGKHVRVSPAEHKALPAQVCGPPTAAGTLVPRTVEERDGGVHSPPAWGEALSGSPPEAAERGVSVEPGLPPHTAEGCARNARAPPAVREQRSLRTAAGRADSDARAA